LPLCQNSTDRCQRLIIERFALRSHLGHLFLNGRVFHHLAEGVPIIISLGLGSAGSGILPGRLAASSSTASASTIGPAHPLENFPHLTHIGELGRLEVLRNFLDLHVLLVLELERLNHLRLQQAVDTLSLNLNLLQPLHLCLVQNLAELGVALKIQLLHRLLHGLESHSGIIATIIALPRSRKLGCLANEGRVDPVGCSRVGQLGNRKILRLDATIEVRILAVEPIVGRLVRLVASLTAVGTPIARNIRPTCAAWSPRTSRAAKTGPTHIAEQGGSLLLHLLGEGFDLRLLLVGNLELGLNGLVFGQIQGRVAETTKTTGASKSTSATRSSGPASPSCAAAALSLLCLRDIIQCEGRQHEENAGCQKDDSESSHHKAPLVSRP
jgi:hypothetical protein